MVSSSSKAKDWVQGEIEMEDIEGGTHFIIKPSKHPLNIPKKAPSSQTATPMLHQHETVVEWEARAAL
jgi:hypothetical protein